LWVIIYVSSKSERWYDYLKLFKTPAYKKDLQKKIIKKHMKKEEMIIIKIEQLLINSENMKEVVLNPLSKIYNIEKKSNDLKEIYTARINSKIRMYIKPIGDYPYRLEKILEIELVYIDDKHYGDG